MRSAFEEIKQGLEEIRDHPETLKRTEIGMTEIGYFDDDVAEVTVDGNLIGSIAKLRGGRWLAIPNPTSAGNVDLRHSVHKLRREAVAALK